MKIFTSTTQITERKTVKNKETGMLNHIFPPNIADIALYKLKILLFPGAESKITPFTCKSCF